MGELTRLTENAKYMIRGLIEHVYQTVVDVGC
jgi:hypothetical protein